MQKTLATAAILFFAILPEVSASEAAGMTKLIILNEKGTPAQEINLGDKLLIQSSLRNNNQIEQEFVYVVQVQDSAGYTVFLSRMNGTLKANQTLEISWEPEKEDIYIVKAFVWTSIDSPAPISLLTQKAIVDLTTQIVASCGSAKCFAGTVTKVTDGDTLRIDGIAIRLALANTPERGEAEYSEATAFTSSLCPEGATAVVDEDDGQTEGSYGRMVAKVYFGNKMLNEELLRAGHAEIYTQFCNVSEFGVEDWTIKHGC